VRAGSFFIGVREDAEPVKPRLLDKLLQNLKVAERFAGEADDEAGAQRDLRDRRADFLQRLQKNFGAGAPLHTLQNGGRRVLQWQVEIFADVRVLRDGLDQAAGNAVGIGIEEADRKSTRLNSS